MKLFVVLLIAFPALFFSCMKTDINLGSHKGSEADLIIQSGFECGWGSGTDSLEISKTTIKYAYYIPARSAEPVTRKSRNVSDAEWTEIINDVNMDEFERLNYHTCNVCFDGCDEWILIRNKTYNHKITFGKGTQIDTISNLQNKLAALRLEFNK
jgi:hypothetical protein